LAASHNKSYKKGVLRFGAFCATPISQTYMKREKVRKREKDEIFECSWSKEVWIKLQG
jgi:hypothetical protein